MIKTAWVFPGQGSQAPGMGVDLLELPSAKVKFKQAEEILGWSVLDICQGESDQLSQTLYTQPALYVVESILADLLMEQGERPNLVAGHSLGEYVALYTARVFNFEAGLRLVQHRAKLMDSATEGMMVALIGFKRPELEEKIQQIQDVVIANDNSPAQVVISGRPTAVQDLLSQIKVKRAVPLKVSGAFHSPLMAQAAAQFQELLLSVPFADAQVPVLSNVDPVPRVEAATLKHQLQCQITGSVRWREISLRLPVEGIEKVVEVGPGKVLTGLIKRMCPKLILENVNSIADLQQCLAVS
ncbi:[acyl-carrier-protein] S-malonyltransferase [Moorena producens PAL-8-15-08-1]|uniref:Malonyl CoA-acyl carrier protein transacylase n=1 Tax=Moorena producens PAL-8-15-08-1 TaxID=1458985 RepID=A0A1D8U1U4_9CYAN|nr:ACP S-malonyltransferase [Moorena producens]AOX03793.1 [acyl-carrier-protein] S-malonyltransferase [Moorena producens PAL-8-15-08-1]